MDGSEAAPRVALLARAGEACERIDSALREAGAEVVLVADPQEAAPEQVREARPQAILVALDPVIVDAIDRYGDVLADPDYLVIFEEADQVAQRTGWDAARWLRHLSAKLHRHSDVLPAGAEAEDELHPTPGPLLKPAAALDLEQAIEAVTGEARQLADDVPRDSGLERLTEWHSLPPAEAPFEDEGPAPLEDATVVEADGDVGDGFDFATGLDLAPIAASAGEGTDADELSFDPERFNRAGRAAEASGGIEEFLAAQGALGPADDADAGADDVAGAAEARALQSSGEAGPVASTEIDFSGLSLVEDDVPLPAAPGAAPRPAVDLDSLGSGLSLADPDSYGHGPKRGAVLIEAGLGGPDAVRQLLAAIPEGFPRPILIRLALDGGRYDRLVRQMARATQAPVAVAEQGQAVRPGDVYFVPPGFGIRSTASGWTFDESLPFDSAALFAANESAVLFLSGADVALVADVTGGSWAAGLVLAQTPDDGCYDPAAADAAIAAGAAHGEPAALAARLLERWPPPGQPSNPDPSGMLSP